MKDLVTTWLFLEIGKALCDQAVETELIPMWYEPLVGGAYDTALLVSLLTGLSWWMGLFMLPKYAIWKRIFLYSS